MVNYQQFRYLPQRWESGNRQPNNHKPYRNDLVNIMIKLYGIYEIKKIQAECNSTATVFSNLF